MEGIAGIGMGEAFIVTEDAEAEETAERFRTYVEAPILTDIQVSFEGFDAYDTEPSSVPTLFASRPVVLFGKWRGSPADPSAYPERPGTRNIRRRSRCPVRNPPRNMKRSVICGREKSGSTDSLWFCNRR